MLWVCLNTQTRMLMFTASPQNMRPNNLTERKCVQWVNDSVFPPQPANHLFPTKISLFRYLNLTTQLSLQVRSREGAFMQGALHSVAWWSDCKLTWLNANKQTNKQTNQPVAAFEAGNPQSRTTQKMHDSAIQLFCFAVNCAKISEYIPAVHYCKVYSIC